MLTTEPAAAATRACDTAKTSWWLDTGSPSGESACASTAPRYGHSPWPVHSLDEPASKALFRIAVGWLTLQWATKLSVPSSESHFVEPCATSLALFCVPRGIFRFLFKVATGAMGLCRTACGGGVAAESLDENRYIVCGT